MATLEFRKGNPRAEKPLDRINRVILSEQFASDLPRIRTYASNNNLMAVTDADGQTSLMVRTPEAEEALTTEGYSFRGGNVPFSGDNCMGSFLRSELRDEHDRLSQRQRIDAFQGEVKRGKYGDMLYFPPN